MRAAHGLLALRVPRGVPYMVCELLVPYSLAACVQLLAVDRQFCGCVRRWLRAPVATGGTRVEALCALCGPPFALNCQAPSSVWSTRHATYFDVGAEGLRAVARAMDAGALEYLQTLTLVESAAAGMSAAYLRSAAQVLGRRLPYLEVVEVVATSYHEHGLAALAEGIAASCTPLFHRLRFCGCPHTWPVALWRYDAQSASAATHAGIVTTCRAHRPLIVVSPRQLDSGRVWD